MAFGLPTTGDRSSAICFAARHQWLEIFSHADEIELAHWHPYESFCLYLALPPRLGMSTLMTGRIPASSDAAAGEAGGFDGDIVQCQRERIRRFTLGHYHHEMGEALLAADDRAAALDAFERAVVVNPEGHRSVLSLVRLLEDVGDRERARTVLANAGGPDALARGLADESGEAAADGLTDDALALMAQALALSERAAAHRPDTVVALAGELGDQHEEALRWCDLAAPHARDLYGLHHQRAFSLLLLNRQDESRRALLASIALAPEQMPSWYVLGQYHRLRFETGAAIASYRRVWKSHHPLREWAGVMVAYTLLIEGRLHEAMEVCDAVWRQEPSMTWALVMRGLVHFRAGDLDAAARALDEGRLNDPDTSRARVFRGMLKIARKQPREALVDFHGKRGDFACLALARLGRARALLDLGDPEEARRLVRAAVTEEGLWIAATLWLLGPLGDPLTPLLAAVGYAPPDQPRAPSAGEGDSRHASVLIPAMNPAESKTAVLGVPR